MLTDSIIKVAVLSVEHVKQRKFVIKTTGHVQTVTMVQFILLYAKVKVYYFIIPAFYIFKTISKTSCILHFDKHF